MTFPNKISKSWPAERDWPKLNRFAWVVKAILWAHDGNQENYGSPSGMWSLYLDKHDGV